MNIETDIGLLKILSKNNVIYASYFVPKETIPTNQLLMLDYLDGVDNYKMVVTQSSLLSYEYPPGTPFQILVWTEIKKIPWGQTRTYSQIAEAIGHPTSCRAVANACGKNQLAFIIPCHRLVGKNNIGGYKWGLDVKKWLLEFEKNNDLTYQI